MSDEKNRYVKSEIYVKWLSEGGENCCDECKSKNGRIYAAEEAAKLLPVHPNCKCKAVDTVSVKSEKVKEGSIISSFAQKFICGTEKARGDILRMSEKYSNPDKKLPQKEGRSYYRMTFGEREHLIFSSDGMCFVTYNGFKTVYPVENSLQAQQHKKKREEEFFGEFEKEIEIFEENEMPPAAYSYIMKNIYDWYASDSVAKRVEIESRLRRFREVNYEYTGDEETDRLIEKMDKRPEEADEIIFNSEIHYFRNKLNIEFDWETFQKIQNRLPEKYKWEEMSLGVSLYHQIMTMPPLSNKKYVSFDGYFEAVYTYDGELLNEETSKLNMGTYNYAPSTEGGFNAIIGHFVKDMLTYWLLGNVETHPKE